MLKHILCALLCLILLLGLLPSPALAANVTVSTYSEALEAARILSGLQAQRDCGGIYLIDDGAKVGVLLVKATTARKNEIRAMVQNPELLVFKSAKHSYLELEKTQAMIDSNKNFKITGSGIDIKNNCVIVNVYYGGEAAARAYYKKYGDKVKVIGEDPIPKGDEYDAINISGEQWIHEVFPDAKELSAANTRFVFSGAPKAVKTHAELSSQGESLTLYLFGNKKEYATAKAMIRGTTVVYNGKVVYVDTEFASTYFYNDASNMIALYCGSEQGVFATLQDRNFYPAGGLGGFFARRNWAIYQNASVINEPDENTPDSPKALRKLSDAVCLGQVKSAPTAKGKFGTYEIEVKESIRGAAKNTLRVSAMPGVMEVGRTYVVFLIGNGDPAKDWWLTDGAYSSVFELNDEGFVLPVREYGMTKPVSLAAFKKSL